MNKNTEDLKNILDHLELVAIYRTLHNNENIPFSSIHKHSVLQDSSHVWSHNSPNKFKIEIIPSIFSNHGSLKLKITNRKKMGKSTNMCKLNNTFLNNQCGSKKKSQGKLENIL